MKIDHIISELEKNKLVFKDLLTSVDKDLISWQPQPGKWSLLEIICHLCDEEREDFRARVQLVLNNPEEPWPQINPQEWVVSRKYSEQNYSDKISEFVAERDKSLFWLKNLENPKWVNAYHHPKVGPVTAELLLVNWLAHDYLHIRQITRNKYLYLKNNYHVPLDYAGEW